MSIETKLDKIIEEMNEIKIELAKQHITLKDHIRRTELLEKAISLPRILALCGAIAAIIESLHWVMK